MSHTPYLHGVNLLNQLQPPFVQESRDRQPYQTSYRKVSFTTYNLSSLNFSTVNCGIYACTLHCLIGFSLYAVWNTIFVVWISRGLRKFQINIISSEFRAHPDRLKYYINLLSFPQMIYETTGEMTRPELYFQNLDLSRGMDELAELATRELPLTTTSQDVAMTTMSSSRDQQSRDQQSRDQQSRDQQSRDQQSRDQQSPAGSVLDLDRPHQWVCYFRVFLNLNKVINIFRSTM